MPGNRGAAYVPPSTARIHRLLDRQGRQLDRLTDRQARQVLVVLDATRRELREELTRMEATGRDLNVPFTAQRMRVMQAQAEDGVRRLVTRLNTQLTAAAQAQGELALAQVLSQVEMGESEFGPAGSQIEFRALTRLTEAGNLALHRRSLERYGLDAIQRMQRVMVVGVARGASIRTIRDRLLGASNSVLAAGRHRAELIARMETSGAYNRMHAAALEEAAAVLDEPGREDVLLRRADEALDARNHPLSRALHGRTFPVRGPMSVPASAVYAWSKAMKRPASGVVWERIGSRFVGAHYPAHFNDRGRQTAWRASWGDAGQQAPPKPPSA